MNVDLIPAGHYEAVIAAAEDAQTPKGYFMRRLTMVVVSPGSPYVGAVLYAFCVSIDAAAHVWSEACEHPRDLDVRQRYVVDVIEETTLEWGRRNSVRKLALKPGNYMPPERMPRPWSPPAASAGSRRSALEADRARIDQTVDTFLFEAAEPGPLTEPQPYADRHGQSGVAFPDTGIQGGAILVSGYARRLGAQLIRAADIHDAIQEGGR